MKISTSSLPAVGFLRLPQVLALIPVSKSTWYAGMQSGRYPKGIKIGEHATAWRVDDIRTLIKQMDAEGL